MAKTTLTNAFGAYGAELINYRWHFSAIAKGSLVLCCWEQFFFGKDKCRYREKLSRWDVNPNGGYFARIHVRKAFDEKMSVRVVLVRVADSHAAEAVEKGESATGDRVPKTFHVQKNLVGTVVKLNKLRFEIEFKSEK